MQSYCSEFCLIYCCWPLVSFLRIGCLCILISLYEGANTRITFSFQVFQNVCSIHLITVETREFAVQFSYERRLTNLRSSHHG